MSIDIGCFESLCSEYSSAQSAKHIGTYNEKRLHLILKRMICDNEECHEVKIGRYVADVFDGEHITEIQTKNLYLMRQKLEYYLSNTDYGITVIHPVIDSKRIVHMDKESGEVKSIRRSPRRIKAGEVLEHIYQISDYVGNERLSIIVLYVTADEYRYSSVPVRYRKSGKYDSELFPKTITKVESYCGAESYRYLLSDCPDVFAAKEYGALKGISGRPLYATLNLLCALGLLSRSKGASRAYEYTVIKNG